MSLGIGSPPSNGSFFASSADRGLEFLLLVVYCSRKTDTAVSTSGSFRGSLSLSSRKALSFSSFFTPSLSSGHDIAVVPTTATVVLFFSKWNKRRRRRVQCCEFQKKLSIPRLYYKWNQSEVVKGQPRGPCHLRKRARQENTTEDWELHRSPGALHQLLQQLRGRYSEVGHVVPSSNALSSIKAFDAEAGKPEEPEIDGFV
ncbi:hypothetical protein VNO80_23068 [Phaseolus coccineus]|uniref:Uncharacterized protein n=1 Tax=Phaseolus coccineus TaxID=3886 RepID=A0AAN9M5A4_PHACN